MPYGNFIRRLRYQRLYTACKQGVYFRLFTVLLAGAVGSFLADKWSQPRILPRILALLCGILALGVAVWMTRPRATVEAAPAGTIPVIEKAVAESAKE